MTVGEKHSGAANRKDKRKDYWVERKIRGGAQI